MFNKPMTNFSFRVFSTAIVIAVTMAVAVNPIPVEATCNTVGGVTTCDGDSDTFTGESATADNQVVTNTITGDGGGDLLNGGFANGTSSTVTNTISGEVGDDRLNGGNANGNNSTITDTLIGGEGNDILFAGNAFGNTATMDNTLNGGEGSDIIGGGNSYGENIVVLNKISGGEGNDLLFPGNFFGTTNINNNIIDGGNGTDTLDYSAYNSEGGSQGVFVDLSNPNPQETNQKGTALISTDTISNVENLVGTNYDDTLFGTVGSNDINGGTGNDIINGNGGADTLSGEGGNDTIILPGNSDGTTVDGGDGSNTIQFMANTFGSVVLTTTSGLDTLDFSQYNAPITIDLANVSSSQLVATVAANQLWVTLNGLFQNVIGALTFSNNLTGNSLDNTLTGGDQNDFLNGGGGSNVLNGGLGEDTDSAATPVPGDVINESGTWNSIELPLPLPVETENPGDGSVPTDVTLAKTLGVGGPGIIPVTGGLMKLTCGDNTFKLPNGDMVTVTGLCGNFWINVQSESNNLPGGLPDGASFLSGISVHILQGDDASNLTELTSLPQSGNIKFSFVIQEPNQNLNSLLWGGSGGWTEMGGGQVSGNSFIVSTNQVGTAVMTKK